MTIETVNLAAGVHFENPFCLQNIYELLPCVSIPGFLFDPTKTMPYFGVEKICVGVKSADWGSRGARCITKSGKEIGAMKNCVSIDYQLLNKNNNIKNYHNLIQICGLYSMEQGIKITESYLNFLNKIHKSLIPFFEKKGKERKKFIDEVIMNIVLNDEDEILKLESSRLNKKYQKAIEEYPEMQQCIRIFISYLEWYPTLKEYKKKLKIIKNLSVNKENIFCETGILKVKEYKYLQGTYSDDLKYSSFPLKFLSKELRDRGYAASFSNEKGKSIKLKLEDPIKYSVTIYDTGNVKIISSEKSSRVIKHAGKFINLLNEILEEEMQENTKEKIIQRIKSYTNALLQQEQIHKSPKSINEIFDEL